MVILTAENLTKSFADRLLFENLSFALNVTDRVALIGINGSGKTTLLRLLAGIETPDSGRVVLGREGRVAYLPQNPEMPAEMSVLEYIFQAETPTIRLLRDYQALLARMEREPFNTALLERLHQLDEEMERLGAYQAETNARTILSKLEVKEIEAKLGLLSGGQRKRVALARALIDRADLLILDEPTNQLDIETVAWLEEYLVHSQGALLLVTHDRYFLDRVVTHIFELEHQRLYSYGGNYESFLIARAERERLTDAFALKQQNLLRKEMAWLLRGARARSTKQKAHIQKVEALIESVQNAPTARDELTIALASRRLGKRAIEIRNLSKSWPGKQLMTKLNYDIQPGARIGIVGPNGAGKSTFLNLLAGKLAPDVGEIRTGETVRMAYYDQESRELPNDMRVITYIQEGAQLIRLADGTKVTAARLLEWFLFPPEQHYSWIGKLSGGEKRRLYLLRTLMEQPNVLLLDEPTNDLDIQTLTVLEDYLDQFSGIVISVSHDRYFLDRVARFILAFEANGTIREYPGNYTLYEEMRLREKSTKTEVQPTAKEKARTSADSERGKEEKKRKLTWKEQRELEQIEEQMGGLETRLSQLEKEMAGVATDYIRFAKVQTQHESLQNELERMMERWMELSE